MKKKEVLEAIVAMESIIPVMREYANGKQIQVKEGDIWIDVLNPNFTWGDEYRVKPEIIYEPFTIEDAPFFREKWIKRENDGEISKISAYNNKKIAVIGTNPQSIWLSYGEVFDLYLFEDGSRFGKIKKD